VQHVAEMAVQATDGPPPVELPPEAVGVARPDHHGDQARHGAIREHLGGLRPAERGVVRCPPQRVRQADVVGRSEDEDGIWPVRGMVDRRAGPVRGRLGQRQVVRDIAASDQSRDEENQIEDNLEDSLHVISPQRAACRDTTGP
jgi:hypothetical protein